MGHNREDYYQLDDETINNVIFTKENVKHFRKYQKSIEIIGIVGDVEMKSSLFKFLLINKEEDVIDVTVWEKHIIEQMKNKITPGNTIHLDGAFVKPKHQDYSKSTFAFDLGIMSNTQVRVLQMKPVYVAPLEDLKVVTIEDAVKHTGLIQIVAYIKNVIKEVSVSENVNINQGCLSDCKEYKLEIRMPATLDLTQFKIGSHVKVTGCIKYGTHPYIWIADARNVALESDEVKKLADLLKGTKIPKRIDNENSERNSTYKRMKKE